MSENPEAFPGAYCVGPNDDLYPPTPGMTLRDWFAGQALSSVMATAQNMDESTEADRAEVFASIAGWMYEMADAMLAHRLTKETLGG